MNDSGPDKVGHSKNRSRSWQLHRRDRAQQNQEGTRTEIERGSTLTAPVINNCARSLTPEPSSTSRVNEPIINRPFGKDVCIRLVGRSYTIP